MTLDSIYLLTFGLGLASGFSHCIGMCGIFVVSYAGMPEQSGKQLIHPEKHLLFHGGRLLMLSFLGLIGGTIGALAHRWAVTQGLMSILVGVVMLGLALGIAGIVPKFRLPEPDILGAGGGRLRRLYRSTFQSQSFFKPFWIGVFVGLLPCGLTYNALQATFTLSPFYGAFLMLCFGLGTIPGLLTLGVFGNALFGGLLTRLPFRIAMTRVSAIFMAILGISFLWRGWENF